MGKRHASAQKRARQSITRNRRNRTIKSQVRAAMKDYQTSTDAASRQKQTIAAQSVLDRAVAKGVLHKNRVARLKSQIMRRKAASPAPEATA